MTCKRIHRAVGWMTGILLILHVIMAILVEQRGWNLGEKRNLFAFIVCPPHSINPAGQVYNTNFS